MLQAVPQPGLLLRRQPAELRIIFEGAALLCGRHILVMAKPVSGVAGLVLRRMDWIGAAGAGMTFFLKAVPLSVRMLRLRVVLRWRWLRLMPALRERGLDERSLGERSLGERGRQQQKRCQTARNLSPAQHLPSPILREHHL